ncbi:MAG: ATP-binding protein [Candidatus Omnitrophota bacterium]
MDQKERRILIVEDVSADAELTERELRRQGVLFKALCVKTKDDFVKALAEFLPDIILCDFKLPSFDGYAALALKNAVCPSLPLIIVSGAIGEESAVDLLKRGAADYVLKDRLFRLGAAVTRALEDAENKIMREKAEEALRRSEAAYRTIFESANDAMVIEDLSTYDIVDANGKASEMFGYSRSEIAGLPLASLNAAQTRESLKKIKEYYAQASRGDPQLFEWLVKDKEGREFWVEIHIKRAMIGGKECVLSTARDITERRKLLAQKDNFLDMVSHELRTPLCIVKEGVALISDGGIVPLDESGKEIIQITKKNIDRLARFIDEVLELQRLNAGKSQVRLIRNDMNALIKDVCRDMTPLAAKKGLRLIYTLADDLPKITFDKDKIVHVLTNLVGNAIKFTEKGTLLITSQRGENFVRVAVSDTGAGIKAGDMTQLFQRFSQVGKKTGGSGLGLAIAKEFIEMHRGKIGAESEFGKGSTFFFILPIKERRVSLIKKGPAS